MKSRDILSIITNAEKGFPVEKWQINGISVWPLIRIDLMFNLHYDQSSYLKNEVTLQFKIRQATRMAQGFFQYMQAFINDSKHNQHITKSDIVFLSDSDVRTNVNGVWFDRMCDPFVEYLQKGGISSLVLEKSTKYKIPRHYPSIFIQPYLDAALVRRYIQHRKTTFDAPPFDGLDDFTAWIKGQKFNIPLPDNNRIKTIWLAIDAYKDYFLSLLSKVRPKLVFIVSYPNPACLAFILACHIRNIPTIDIQHGVQGEYNAAYGQWTKVPKHGFALLPNYFWCWSQAESNTIRKWSKKVIQNHTPIVGGNLYLNSWLLESSLSKTFEHSIKSISGNYNILVTLSLQDDQNRELLKKIVHVCNQLGSEYKFWIRLHPTDLQKRDVYKNMFEKLPYINYDIEQATGLPLYALLRYARVHITNTSAAVQEAERFGVPSIIASTDGVSYFGEQIKKGTAIKAFTSKEIAKAIQRLILHKKSFVFDSKKIISHQEKWLKMIEKIIKSGKV